MSRKDENAVIDARIAAAVRGLSDDQATAHIEGMLAKATAGDMTALQWYFDIVLPALDPVEPDSKTVH